MAPAGRSRPCAGRPKRPAGAQRAPAVPVAVPAPGPPRKRAAPRAEAAVAAPQAPPAKAASAKRKRGAGGASAAGAAAEELAVELNRPKRPARAARATAEPPAAAACAGARRASGGAAAKRAAAARGVEAALDAEEDENTSAYLLPDAASLAAEQEELRAAVALAKRPKLKAAELKAALAAEAAAAASWRKHGKLQSSSCSAKHAYSAAQSCQLKFCAVPTPLIPEPLERRKFSWCAKTGSWAGLFRAEHLQFGLRRDLVYFVRSGLFEHGRCVVCTVGSSAYATAHGDRGAAARQRARRCSRSVPRPLLRGG